MAALSARRKYDASSIGFLRASQAARHHDALCGVDAGSIRGCEASVPFVNNTARAGDRSALPTDFFTPAKPPTLTDPLNLKALLIAKHHRDRASAATDGCSRTSVREDGGLQTAIAERAGCYMRMDETVVDDAVYL